MGMAVTLPMEDRRLIGPLVAGLPPYIRGYVSAAPDNLKAQLAASEIAQSTVLYRLQPTAGQLKSSPIGRDGPPTASLHWPQVAAFTPVQLPKLGQAFAWISRLGGGYTVDACWDLLALPEPVFEAHQRGEGARFELILVLAPRDLFERWPIALRTCADRLASSRRATGNVWLFLGAVVSRPPSDRFRFVPGFRGRFEPMMRNGGIGFRRAIVDPREP